MKIQFIENLINKKMNINQNEIIFTFYELRVKNNLTEEQTNEFLSLCKTRLENLDYKVFFTGAKFIYKEQKRIVQDNELLVAIKERKECERK